MKIVTYNIRGDFGTDGINNFEFRKPYMLKKIAEEKPDVIGFQEVLPHMQKWLRDNLAGYTVVGRGRGPENDDEAMTLAIRNETTELLGFEVFWLSPEPHIPGSRYENQSICPRTCAMAILQNKEMPGPIRVYNTHLDHISPQARIQGLSQVLRQMEDDAALEELPSVLMGDFNCEPGSVELSPVDEFTSLGLTDITANIPFTFHDFFRGGEGEPCKIDYIYITPPFRVGKVTCWDDVENGVYLSDHYPICAEIFAE